MQAISISKSSFRGPRASKTAPYDPKEAEYIGQTFWKAAGLVDDEIYYDPMRKGAEKNEKGVPQYQAKLREIGRDLVKSGVITVNKATASFDTASGGTFTGRSLAVPFVDPDFVDRTVRETPLVGLLARRVSTSIRYVYTPVTAKAGAEFLEDDGNLNEQTDTYTATTVDMKYLYAVGRITGPMLAGGVRGLLEQDLRMKLASMNEALENEIINGDTSVNAAGFQGLIQSISTNSTDNSGGNITLPQIRSDIADAFNTGGNNGTGLIDLAVTDANTLNYIKGLLMDYQRNVEKPSGRLDFGIPGAFMFDGVMFMRDRFMPTTAASRRLLYLDSRYVYLAVLLDYTYFDLAKTNDSDKFAIKWYGSLVVSFEAACAQRYGLA